MTLESGVRHVNRSPISLVTFHLSSENHERNAVRTESDLRLQREKADEQSSPTLLREP